MAMISRYAAESIGLLAGSCTTLSLVPQLVRIWRARSARDISLTMFAVFTIGILLWLVYGISVRSPAVIVTNAASLLLAVAILVLSVRYQQGR